VAALGEEIRQHPDASPVLLNDPAYVGVAVTSLPGRPGVHRVRTPQVDHHQVAAIIRASAGLRTDPAEHAAESLTKGSRVVVVGRLQQRSWTAEDGSARSTVEVVAEEVGPSLRWATATTTRTTRIQGRPCGRPSAALRPATPRQRNRNDSDESAMQTIS
jgi:hypothetical protein